MYFLFSSDSRKPIITEWTVATIEYVTGQSNNEEFIDIEYEHVDDDEEEDDDTSPPPPPPIYEEEDDGVSEKTANQSRTKQQRSQYKIPCGDVLKGACEVASKQPSITHQQHSLQPTSSSQHSYRTSPLRAPRKQSSLSFDSPVSSSFTHQDVSNASSSEIDTEFRKNVLRFFTSFAAGYSVRYIYIYMFYVFYMCACMLAALTVNMTLLVYDCIAYMYICKGALSLS